MAVELDGEYDITRIEVDVGLQAMMGKIDLFCANAAPSAMDVYADDGSVLKLDETKGKMLAQDVCPGVVMRPIRARRLLFVVRAVRAGAKWPGDLAIGELRVFGRRAAPSTKPDGEHAITHGSREVALLREALVRHCAKKYQRTRPLAECTALLAGFNSLDRRYEYNWAFKIDAKSFAAGKVTLTHGAPDSTDSSDGEFHIEWRRNGTTWAVHALSCTTDEPSPKIPCGLWSQLRHEIEDDELPATGCTSP